MLLETNGNQLTVHVLGGLQPYVYVLDEDVVQSSNIFNNLSNGIHTITVTTDEGCEVSASFSIINKYNFISPNGDGMNDYLDFSYLMEYENALLVIFNRYEDIIFEGSQQNQFIWNGTKAGKELPTGTYWFIIKWTNADTGEINEESGWLMLKKK